MLDIRLRRLQRIYQEIARWAGDQKALPRKISGVQPDARLAVVGEAVGPRTLRLSGVSYFDQAGRLGNTGSKLDQILQTLGYTLYPPRDVKVPKGTIKSLQSVGKKTVYCTDLCPVFPGYEPAKTGKLRIRRPSPALIRSALAHEFLRRELEIVRPRVILLLGADAYRTFYRYFLNEPVPASLWSVVNHMENAKLPTYSGAMIVPLLHPSGASPAFVSWFKSFPHSASSMYFVESVTRCLKS